MRAPSLVFLAWLFFSLALLPGCRNRQGLPLVDDQASLLSREQKTRLLAFHDRLLQDLDIHFQLTVLKQSPVDLDQEALRLFESLQLGATTRGARGVLMLVDPVGRQVRLEIGYDLEGLFPDGFVAYVEREQMAPFFAAGRVADGVEATVELLVGRALGEIPSDYRGSTKLAHLSGGGGARSTAPIGTGAPLKDSGGNPFYAAQPTPGQTLERYMDALARHVKDPDLGIYTPETRAFFRQWLVTDAQQDNERKGLEKALGSSEERASGERAVLRFAVEDRQASPYLFRLSEQGWQLDMATMSRVIGFNHKNQWFFRTLDHPYAFAFDDLRFDSKGFPH